MMSRRPWSYALPPAGAGGQVLVLFILSIIVLVGAVGLGIDGSRVLEERRHAQAAVDHAATAAAHAACAGSTTATAIAMGMAAAALNAYDDSDPDIAVTITHQGGFSFLAGITSIIPGTFAAAIGFPEFDVSVEATAGATGCATGGAGPGAIFAGGSCPGGQWAVDVSGSSQRVFGGVHSNDDVRVGGGSNDFDDIGLDPFTYVGSIDPSSIGNGNTYEVGYPDQVATRSWPAGYEPSEASPDSSNDAYWNEWSAKAVADGHGGGLLTSKITSITTNGVYYTSHADGMDISSISAGVTNITLIARNGPIKVSASSGNFSPDADGDGILILSGKVYSSSENCDKYTVALSGSNTDWNGIIWGPGGLVEFSGSSNSAVNGSLMGWAVRINGSDITLRYDATLFQEVPNVLLLS